MAETISYDDVRVPVGPLIGSTVNKAPWGPRVQWHAAHDLPRAPPKLPESYVPEAAAGSASADSQQQLAQQQHRQQHVPPGGYPMDGMPGPGAMGMDGAIGHTRSL